VALLTPLAIPAFSESSGNPVMSEVACLLRIYSMVKRGGA
jgi:hypothetical protein